MKTIICYFSGTGNTKKVVDCYKQEFENNGWSTTLHAIEKEFNEDLSYYDCIGIAYPIHAFNAPSIVINFCKKLPKLEKPKPLYIIKTSGEPLKINNISSNKIVKILQKKGYILNNEYHYVMPYNMMFRHSNAMAYKMWNTAKKLIPIDCLEIIENKKVKLPFFPLSNLISWVMRIEHWGGRFNGKRYKVSSKCIKCQKCVNNCPTHNITIDKDGNFHFGKNCIMCMRCSFGCPLDAFSIGLLNGWKVNGSYNFNDPDNTEQKSHHNYCKNSYEKYFKRSEQKINQSKKLNNTNDCQSANLNNSAKEGIISNENLINNENIISNENKKNDTIENNENNK